MVFEFAHDVGHQLTHYISSDTHWWIHFVFHLVVFGVPVALIILITAAGFHFVRQRKNKSKTQEKGAGNLGEVVRQNHLLRYICRMTWQQQLRLAVLAVLSLPALYMSLELPKLIINNAIESGHFPAVYMGVELSQTQALLGLCLLFLLVIGIHGWLKYQVNLNSGKLAEHISHRLRLDISRHSFRHEGKGRGHLIPVIVQEVEPIAGYGAEALVLPLLQGGTFLTILAFMLVQDPVLGVAAMALLPIQIFIVPKFQRKINVLSRARLQTVRDLGERIEGLGRGNRSELRGIYKAYRNMHSLRLMIHKKKFMMKSLNNFISQLTPFFFYTIGGYLVITDELTLGALIAVLTAYKDMGAPLKELFRYYQAQADAHVRYGEIAPYALAQQPFTGTEVSVRPAGVP
ncbi:ABC transporter transmembrane domain-containing protein [Thalassospira australica]|uniref:ABC transporter transmembrane domain-containing protein n=1 Tax=Thalassospira australica TaxID=1528106 RepID=UPI00068D4ED7|nr:ABC transporter transmembrane domain-containing protein [Thalassospira australica]